MDIKQIQELVKLVNKSNIGELSIEKNDFKITIKQKEEPAQHFAAPVQQQPQQQQVTHSSNYSCACAANNKHRKHAATKTENLLTIKSPMIGTFYRASGPDKPYL